MGSLVVSLRGTLVVVASKTAWTRGHLGFTKNLRGNRSEELCIPSRTFGWSPQMLCLNTQNP